MIFNFCFADEHWQEHWLKGKDFFANSLFEEAALEFDFAIHLMSEQEKKTFPSVVVDRVENDYVLGNLDRILADTELALNSENITDYERLFCGLRRIAVFLSLNMEDVAVEEYLKYVSGCPLFPKYDRFDNHIVIRNIPDCNCYKKWTKENILSKYCSSENDIKDYGNTWVANITKNQCGCNAGREQNSIHQKTNLTFQQRDQKQIEACCNTCNRLATAASVICGCLPVPPVLGGPITQSACRVACVMFVDTLKNDCEKCCYNSNGTCWTCFETWKDQFKKEHPDCPHPPKNCPK
jgi:hypothetical protein